MAFAGTQHSLEKIFRETGIMVSSKPQLFPALNRKLLRIIIQLGDALESDDLTLLGFYLADLYRPLEAYASILVKEMLKRALPDPLVKSGLNESEVASVLGVVEDLDLTDLIDSTGKADVSKISKKLNEELKESLFNEAHRSTAIGEIIKAFNEGVEIALQEVGKDLSDNYREIADNIDKGIDVVHKCIEKYLLLFHKKVMKAQPGATRG